jgi:predicted nuclease of restriction endonuclease-like (RecB) superfamily
MKYAQLVKVIAASSQQLLGRAAATVNQALVIRNWLVGAYIVEFEQNGEDRARYGTRLLERLAADLGERGLKGLGDPRLLRECRLLYRLYPQIRGTLSREFVASLPQRSEIRQAPSDDSTMKPEALAIRRTASRELLAPLSAGLVLKLSWSQLQELIRLDDPLKRAFYENECLKGNWSVRQLQRQIGSLLFERTGLSTNKTAVLKRACQQEAQRTIADLLRDPYVLEFTGLAERAEYHETDLEKALLDHLQSFLLELGTGFLFEARHRRITVGNENDYLDLVFYHRHLRCHVLLDLKVRAFRHGDAGQMNFYLNWWKQNVTADDEQPPVGILLCSDKDQTKVEFATAGMDNRLFVARYLVALPSAEQLRRFLETDRARVEAVMQQSGRARTKKPKRTRAGRGSKRRATGKSQ